MGHEVDTNENEQGGEQMPIPVCRDVQKQENRPEVLQVALGAFLETATLLENLHRKRWSRSRNSKREKLRIGSAALRPLHARCFRLLRPPLL